MNTIERSELVRLAQESVNETEIPAELAKIVLDVARTASYISADWSAEVHGYGECGCLIGTARMACNMDPCPAFGGDGEIVPNDLEEENVLGMRFYTKLTNWSHEHNMMHDWEPFEVLDN